LEQQATAINRDVAPLQAVTGGQSSERTRQLFILTVLDASPTESMQLPKNQAGFHSAASVLETGKLA